MQKPFKRVLLHIGPPKTGSTSIQHFLFSNRAALQARGIYVPLATSRGLQHIELPLFFRPQRDHLERLTGVSSGEIEARREAVTNAFAAEIDGVGGGETLLISSEHMFGGNPSVIDAYQRFFAPYAERFECVMYLRRQDRWIASSVLQRRKAGPNADMRFRISGPPNGFGQSLRHWDTLADECHIRRFDKEFLVEGSLLKDFCSVINCDANGLQLDASYNHALLQEQFELVDALNASLAEVTFGRQIAYRSGFLPLCSEVLGGSAFEFPRAIARAAFDAYAPVNRWLRETRDPEGPALFFNDDFNEYPIEARNDRLYSEASLARLLDVINEKLRSRNFQVSNRRSYSSRYELIGDIVYNYIALHDGEAEQARKSRRNAAMEARKQARRDERVASDQFEENSPPARPS